MLTYDCNGVVSFLTEDLGDSYAVTGVPEPATLTLLALGGGGAVAAKTNKMNHEGHEEHEVRKGKPKNVPFFVTFVSFVVCVASFCYPVLPKGFM